MNKYTHAPSQTGYLVAIYRQKSLSYDCNTAEYYAYPKEIVNHRIDGLCGGQCVLICTMGVRAWRKKWLWLRNTFVGVSRTCYYDGHVVADVTNSKCFVRAHYNCKLLKILLGSNVTKFTTWLLFKKINLEYYPNYTCCRAFKYFENKNEYRTLSFPLFFFYQISPVVIL